MKDWVFKITKGIVLINGLGQLAVSQIHILASTKLFASEIGVYLFMFVIFGLVTAFNTFLLKKLQGMIFFIVSCWVTAGSGYIYLKLLQADVAAQEALTMAEVNDSWMLAVISIGICLIGSVAIPLLGWKEIKTTEF